MRRNNDEDSSSSTKNPPFLKFIDSSLRLCVVPLCVATIWLTVTNHQYNPGYGNLDYSNLLGLKYMVWVSAICAGYAVVSAVSSWVRCLVCRALFFFVPDQIAAYLMVTSTAAVSEIVYLAYKGDKEVTWSEACSSYAKFCSKLTLALSLHVLSLFSFILLSVISAYRAFRLFDPPHHPN